jgi:hypothetical protein
MRGGREGHPHGEREQARAEQVGAEPSWKAEEAGSKAGASESEALGARRESGSEVRARVAAREARTHLATAPLPIANTNSTLFL